MREIPLDEITIVGALDVERTATGLAPRRLPAWTRPQLPDDLTRVMVAMTAGVRLAFTTTATTIELDAMVSMFVRPGANERPIAFELLVDGEVVSRAETLDGNRIAFDLTRNRFELIEGEPARLRFDDLPAGPEALRAVAAAQRDGRAAVVPHRRRRRCSGSPDPVHAATDAGSITAARSATARRRRRPTTTWPAIVALARRRRPPRPRASVGAATSTSTSPAPSATSPPTSSA